MPITVFVSCARIDETYAADLIRKLQQRAFAVQHSPCNPLDGEDDRWRDWYTVGCQSALDRTDLVVIVIANGWDCSTWMVHEAAEAIRRRDAGTIRRVFYFNPAQIPVRPEPMQQAYMKERLPDDLDAAINVLAGA